MVICTHQLFWMPSNCMNWAACMAAGPTNSPTAAVCSPRSAPMPGPARPRVPPHTKHAESCHNSAGNIQVARLKHSRNALHLLAN